MYKYLLFLFLSFLGISMAQAEETIFFDTIEYDCEHVSDLQNQESETTELVFEEPNSIENVPLMLIDRKIEYGEGYLPKNSKWQGIYCNINGCKVKNTKVYIKTKKKKSGAKEIVQTKGKPISLFADSYFKTGNVVTWYLLEDDLRKSFKNSKLGDFYEKHEWYLNWGTQPLTLTLEVGSDYYTNFYVSDGNNKQLLLKYKAIGKYGTSLASEIHWIGDLDHDGKLDLIINTPSIDCPYNERLFLSSKAGDGEFLKLAASNNCGYEIPF